MRKSPGLLYLFSEQGIQIYNDGSPAAKSIPQSLDVHKVASLYKYNTLKAAI